MTDKEEIKKYCSGIDCLTCNEAEPCIYRIANKLQEQLESKEQECEEMSNQLEILNEKLLHKRAVVEFADCPHYSYGDNTIEPTCTKNFCYDVESCDHKNMVKYKQALDKIEKLIPKFESSDGCDYGDFDCENCSDLDEDIVCTYKLK